MTPRDDPRRPGSHPGSHSDSRPRSHPDSHPGSGPRRRRIVLVTLGVLVVALLAAVGWLVRGGLSARDDLLTAQGALSRARQVALDGDLAQAHQLLAEAQAATTAALATTSDPVWRVVTAVPGVGDTPRAVRTVAAQADLLATGAAPDLLAMADTLSPERLRTGAARLDIAAIARMAEPAARAQRELRGVQHALAAAGDGWVLPVVGTAVTDLRNLVDGLAGTVDTLARTVRLAPPMLGADGPRRYFVAFQNPAEARGTGGLVGAYGILAADAGRLRFVELGTDDRLRNPPTMPVDLGEEFTTLYGDDPTWWVNSNMSPHFPYAARLWMASWQQMRGQALDGAVALDPVALSYVLAVTGPVGLPGGEQISAENVVRRTLVDAYVRFADDNAARKQYLVTVMSAVVDRMLAWRGDPRALLGALARAADERRLLVWSAHPAEQAELTHTSLSGALPTRSGPYLLVTVVNAAGSKLDTYLRREVTYRGQACRVGQSSRATRVTVQLTNDVPADARLPDYVTGRLAAPDRLPVRNSTVELVGVYGARGAQVIDVTVDGRRVPFRLGSELGHAAVLVPVTLQPGRTHELVVTLDEPPSTRAPQVQVQPLTTDQRTVVDVPACRR